jgi:hypothetical protein
LSVGIAEVAALQKRIVGEADTRDDMAGTESDLLCLREALVDVAVEL